MATKQLQTRIALKYDTYENWTKEQPADSAVGANLVLLKGEIGICEVTPANANANESVVPTVLFKVGNGTKKFHELPWASAKAADVYSWAKQSEEDFKAWLNTTAGFATDAEVAALVGNFGTDEDGKVITAKAAVDAEAATRAAADSAMNARIATLEGHFGEGDNNVDTKIAALDERLDILEGEDTIDGSVKKALKDAKAYADEKDTALKTELQGYADKAEEDAVKSANEYTDDKVSEINAEIADLKIADTTLGGRIDAIYKVDGETKSGALADEITRATNAETALGGRIDGVITAYGEAD